MLQVRRKVGECGRLGALAGSYQRGFQCMVLLVAKVHVASWNTIFWMCLLSLALQRCLLIHLIHLLQANSSVSFLCPLQNSSMWHWKHLAVFQRNRLNHPAEAKESTMTAADSGEAAWAGRLLTGRKPKGMVSQKSHWWDQHSLEIQIVLQWMEFVKVVLFFLSTAAFWGYLT